MKITIFESDNASKIAKSPFENENKGKFNFSTVDVPLNELSILISKMYYMSRQFNINGTYNKNKKDLEDKLSKDIEYIILDIDKLYSEQNKNEVINFIKDKGYPCIICKSRGYNGINKFTLKGLFLVDGYNSTLGIKEFLSSLQMLVGNIAEIDLSVIRTTSYQAPTLQDNAVLYENFSGKKPYIRNISKIEYDEIKSDAIIVNTALTRANTLGFKVVDEKSDLYVLKHPNEKTPKGYFIFKNYPFIIHHFNPIKSINILKDIINQPEVRAFIKNEAEIKREKILLKEYESKNHIKVNERFLKSENKMKFLEDFLQNGDILKIKSPMGSGKSNLILALLNINEKRSKPTKKRILFVTNRISIAKDIKKKYTNLKLYLDGDWRVGDNLICQFDSLWRFDLNNFDLVIMDEFMSLLLHSRSNANDNPLNKIKFFYALKKKLIIIDAFLFRYEDNILDINKKVYIIENEFKEKTKLIEYKNENKLISKMIEIIEKSKKPTTISCNTKIMVNSLKKLFETKNKNVIIIDSSVNELEREQIYETFKNDDVSYDVLIYSPSLTVGVSIDFVSDYHFHIDTNNTIDVISSLQMLKRNRSAKEIHFFYKKIDNVLNYNYDTLLDEFNKEINKKALKNGILIDIDNCGNFKASNIAEFQLSIEALFNLLMTNSYRTFKMLLDFQFLNDSELNIEVAEPFMKIYRDAYKQEEQKLGEMISLKIDAKTPNKRSEEIEQYFLGLTNEELSWLVKESSKNRGIVSQINNLKIFKNKECSQRYNRLNSTNIIQANEKKKLSFMSFMENKLEIKNRFIINDLKKFNAPLSELKSLLLSLGYKWKYNSYILEDIILNLVEKIHY